MISFILHTKTEINLQALLHYSSILFLTNIKIRAVLSKQRGDGGKGAKRGTGGGILGNAVRTARTYTPSFFLFSFFFFLFSFFFFLFFIFSANM